jgi:Flp pilus assembly protein TadD
MALLAFALMGAGCGSIGVDPASDGYKALEAGEYAKARDYFWAMYSKNPDDPFVELNLAVAYDGLGRMDLAEPFYRQVLDNGRNIAAPATRNADNKNKTLADIACTDLRRDLQDLANC